MNSKNIAKALKRKLDDWCGSIDNDAVVNIIKENAIVTGGALVSMLNSEYPNDYDIYFKTHDSCLAVAKYYADEWNKTHPDKSQVEIKVAADTKRITAFIQSAGIASEDGDTGIATLKQKQEKEPDFKIDNTYLFEIINRIF